MKKFAPALALVLLVSIASGQSLIGKWRVGDRRRPNDLAIFQFLNSKSGRILASAGGMQLEQDFQYVLKRDLIELTASRSQRVNGKVRPSPIKDKLVMRLKWRNKDTVAYWTIVKGKATQKPSEMRRIK